MKKYRYQWLTGICLFLILGMLSLTSKVYGEVTNLKPYGNDNFTMDITFEDGAEAELLNPQDLEDCERDVSCVISNNTGVKCDVTIESSNPDVVECSEAYTVQGYYKGNKSFTYIIKGYGKAVITFQIGSYKWEKVISVAPDKTDVLEVKQEDGLMVKIKWQKINGVTGYIIERAVANGNEYAVVATIKKNTDNATIETDGDINYRYRVIPYVQSGSEKVCGGIGVASNPFMVENIPAKIKTIKPYKDDYLKITWTKSSTATGYKLYRSEKKNSGFKCVYTAKSNKTTSWKQKVTKGKKYYYRIVTLFKGKTSKQSPSVPQILPKMQLDRTKTNLLVGKKTELEMKGTSKKVTWSSSNKKVATVNKKGVVTGKKTGTATITAKVGKKKFKCKVTVKKAYLNAEKVTIYEGENTWLNIRGSEIKTIKSSKKKVVSVSKDGWITAKKAGKATVTVKGKNGKTYKCKVTVKKPKTIKNKYEVLKWKDNSVYLESLDAFLPRLTKFNEVGVVRGNSMVGKSETTEYYTGLWKYVEIGNIIDEELDEEGFSSYDHPDPNHIVNRLLTAGGYASYEWIPDGTLGVNGDYVIFGRDDYYEVVIRKSLKENSFFGVEIAKYNRDIFKTILTLVSSEPELVYDAIYECLYEDAYVLSTTEYTKVGDCQVRLEPAYRSFDEDGNGGYFRFYIRPQ